MNKEELVSLAEKVNEGTATTHELALYIAGCEALHMAFQKDAEQWPELDEELSTMEAASLRRFWQSQHPTKIKIFPLWKRATTIAAAVAAIVVGVYFFKFNDTVKIKPGKNIATLTLANGKTIELSDHKTGVAIQGTHLVYNDGSSASTNEIEAIELTATTPKGGTYQFTLPDGTKVWLNAASKLIFPSQFKGGERKVQLEGEAYFAVQHNAKQPFQVYSKGQVVKDIGTEFNINAYTDEPYVRTSLIEGIASVRPISTIGRKDRRDRAEEIILKPGQQAQLKGSAIKVAKVNLNAEVAWKKGEFVFDNESLGSIMRKISRWYNVDIVYRGVDPAETFGGSISRFAEVSKVLENLELTGEIHFKISGRTIYVSQ
ncbi:MAG: DUF4974 domain-containing protein [Candidatus Pedobacter colombiensis]|uniref:DUF4974 domain-containing protein n=1 Tax=Candidatus Pedobacter colombiensis TaxID=3121371 RepID=A0AAJ6B7F1_9SPHI|nr:FecR family protein [Pedobacter sp.]WEK20205.1 MAG: DUF4974 domain-containing protein [Pedobacter sp.]